MDKDAEPAKSATNSVTEDASQFDGDPEELQSLIEDGLDSPEMSESDFWAAVDITTASLVADHKANG